MNMEKKKELWYAVSKSGQGRIFISPPERNEYFGIWVGEHIGCISTLFMLLESEGFTPPAIKWSDNPVKITLNAHY